MSENRCPECQQELSWDGNYCCSRCNAHYHKIAYCPDCKAELEKLAACGAVSYFCHSCNELKSKSNPATRFEFKRID
ncbi:hypothetical protein VA7868_02063 [Vibrio aerogenes CECT 7868]|uniref:DNA ligase n=1 Tax=Vibrio aerogenes CECT 7868 TaxID=1216006 RepID=A0A1M5YXJ7_9VIBR|nr:zinc ribbon domain-containing protein [Vibrio aerogenes]SHI16574.1 hypothetical protein VA7868_02063 [Vibrio aerogenes CECT 7868]